MNSKFSKSILERIEQEKIQPHSKKYFILKNLSIWGVFILAIILGAISFSIILFSLKNTDFDIFDSLGQTTGFSHFLNLLPLFWIFFVGIAIGIGIWGFKHTKKGYKIAVTFIFLGNIFGSIIIGSLVYGAGGGEKLEDIFEAHIPIYQSVRKKHQRIWAHPEKNGRLAGIIQSVDQKNKNLILEDLSGKSWKVSFKNAKKIKNFLLKNDLPIKMKGIISEDNIFSAEKIRPAFRQRHIQEKRRNFFQKHPELRKRLKNLPPKERQELIKNMRNKFQKL